MIYNDQCAGVTPESSNYASCQSQQTKVQQDHTTLTNFAAQNPSVVNSNGTDNSTSANSANTTTGCQLVDPDTGECLDNNSTTNTQTNSSGTTDNTGSAVSDQTNPYQSELDQFQGTYQSMGCPDSSNPSCQSEEGAIQQAQTASDNWNAENGQSSTDNTSYDSSGNSTDNPYGDNSYLTDGSGIPDAPPGADVGSSGGENCQTVTPGSVISSSLNKALGAGQDSLVAADEIDEIIGALASQLVNQVLGPGGLLGTSQTSAGGGTPSYISRIEGEISASNSSAASSAGQTLASSISPVTGYANSVKNYDDQSLQDYQGALAAYSSASLQCQSNQTITDQINSDGNIDNINSSIASLQAQDDAAASATAILTAFSQQVSSVTSTDQLTSLEQEWNAATGLPD